LLLSLLKRGRHPCKRFGLTNLSGSHINEEIVERESARQVLECPVRVQGADVSDHLLQLVSAVSPQVKVFGQLACEPRQSGLCQITLVHKGSSAPNSSQDSIVVEYPQLRGSTNFIERKRFIVTQVMDVLNEEHGHLVVTASENIGLHVLPLQAFKDL